MESNGSLGKVTISEDTKKFLENHFPRDYSYEFNKEVTLGNFKGTDGDILRIQSYFISPSIYEESSSAIFLQEEEEE